MGKVIRRIRNGQQDEFYTCYWTRGGKTAAKKAFKDRGKSLQLLAKLEDEARAAKLGFKPMGGGVATTRLSELATEYLDLLRSRDRDPQYVRDVTTRITRGLAGTRWHVLGDVDSDRLEKFLASVRAGGASPATSNGYLRDMKAFIRWAAKKAGIAFPLDGVKKANEAVDRRRSKRILTDDELGKLIRAAEVTPRRRGSEGICGLDRSMLYRVAAYTGLRASELASLLPQSFDLDSTPPVVLVEAKDAKGKREDRVPLADHLVEVLRPWLATKPPGKRIWPGKWAVHGWQRDWLAADLKRAGVDEKDERGRRATFHGLKRKFVTGLIRAGVGVDELHELARHRSVQTTLGYYTDPTLKNRAAAVNKLPPPPGA